MGRFGYARFLEKLPFALLPKLHGKIGPAQISIVINELPNILASNKWVPLFIFWYCQVPTTRMVSIKKKNKPTRMVQFGCKPNKPYMPYASMYLLVLTIIVLILTIGNILMIRLRVNCTHSASAWQVGVI